MTKNKYIFFFAIVFVIVFLLNSGFASALEIKDYPNIPGLAKPSDCTSGNDCLSIFIAYWFGLLVYIAGILSLISFAIGAVGLINPNIEAHNDAKDRMKGAILGLVLTLASFIIIRTINPTLITPGVTPIQGVQGIFYINGSNERRNVRMEDPNVQARSQELIDGGFNSITYDCLPGQQNTAPALLIWRYNFQNFESINSAGVARMTCGSPPVPVGHLGSFRMEYEKPGVYFCDSDGCSGDMCRGDMSDAITTDQGEIKVRFARVLGGVRIVNGTTGNYGVIFHQVAGLGNGGMCNFPIVGSGAPSCQNVPDRSATAAANIFKVNTTNTSSGDGVAFYSRPFGQLTGSNAGVVYVIDEQTSGNILNDIWRADSTDMCFDYTGVYEPPVYKYRCTETKCPQQNSHKTGNQEGQDCSWQACETFKDCPGSIDIIGKYLIAVYSGGQSGTFNPGSSSPISTYCQTFTADVENLKATPFLRNSGTELDKIYIIPTI